MNTGHKMASAVTLLTALRMFTNGELSLSEDKQLEICDFETYKFVSSAFSLIKFHKFSRKSVNLSTLLIKLSV